MNDLFSDAEIENLDSNLDGEMFDDNLIAEFIETAMKIPPLESETP